MSLPASAPRDLFDNPLGTDGFEFVEFTSPEPERLKDLFEKMGFTATAKPCKSSSEPRPIECTPTTRSSWTRRRTDSPRGK